MGLKRRLPAPAASRAFFFAPDGRGEGKRRLNSLASAADLAQFDIPVSVVSLGQRVIYAESAARGLSVLEVEPHSEADAIGPHRPTPREGESGMSGKTVQFKMPAKAADAWVGRGASTRLPRSRLPIAWPPHSLARGLNFAQRDDGQAVFTGAFHSRGAALRPRRASTGTGCLGSLGSPAPLSLPAAAGAATPARLNRWRVVGGPSTAQSRGLRIRRRLRAWQCPHSSARAQPAPPHAIQRAAGVGGRRRGSGRHNRRRGEGEALSLILPVVSFRADLVGPFPFSSEQLLQAGHLQHL